MENKKVSADAFDHTDNPNQNPSNKAKRSTEDVSEAPNDEVKLKTK